MRCEPLSVLPTVRFEGKLVTHMSFLFQYCIDKSKVLLGLVSDDWQEQVVSQLNTALDEWVDSVPEHSQSLLFCLIRGLTNNSKMVVQY